MIDRWLTKIIDFISPHQKGLGGSEKLFWDNHWNRMMNFTRNSGFVAITLLVIYWRWDENRTCKRLRPKKLNK